MTSEFKIQQTFCEWCKKQDFILEHWHVPNGFHASPTACAMMKKIGLHKGVCDYWVLLKKRGIIAIEFKNENGKLSPEQITFINHLEQVGVKVAVCRSSFEAATFVKQCYKEG